MTTYKTIAAKSIFKRTLEEQTDLKAYESLLDGNEPGAIRGPIVEQARADVAHLKATFVLPV